MVRLLLAIAFLVQGTISAQVLREWQSSNGRFSTDALLIEVSGEHVLLRKESGAEIRVARDKLCNADNEYIEEFLGDQLIQSTLGDPASLVAIFDDHGYKLPEPILISDFISNWGEAHHLVDLDTSTRTASAQDVVSKIEKRWRIAAPSIQNRFLAAARAARGENATHEKSKADLRRSLDTYIAKMRIQDQQHQWRQAIRQLMALTSASERDEWPRALEQVANGVLLAFDPSARDLQYWCGAREKKLTNGPSPVLVKYWLESKDPHRVERAELTSTGASSASNDRIRFTEFESRVSDLFRAFGTETPPPLLQAIRSESRYSKRSRFRMDTSIGKIEFYRIDDSVGSTRSFTLVLTVDFGRRPKSSNVDRANQPEP